MNWFDIVIVALTLFLGLKGLFRGFIKESFALIGIVGGVFLASRLSSQTGQIVNDIFHFDNSNTIALVGFVITIIVVWFLAYILGVILSKIIKLSGLGIFDNILGFIFGASKIFLLFSIIFYAISSVETIDNQLSSKLKNSVIFPILKDTGKMLIKLDTINIKNKDKIPKIIDNLDLKKHIDILIKKEGTREIKQYLQDHNISTNAVKTYLRDNNISFDLLQKQLNNINKGIK